MYILYSLLLACILLLSLPWWMVQMLRHGKYRAGIKERLGWVPDRLRQAAAPGGIWIHAVSVGEVLAISNLLRELELAFPEKKIFVSTTTATGQQLARSRFGEQRCFYLPLDFSLAVNAWLKLLQPSALVLAETEFWPNLLHLSRRRGARVAVVNARISDRSLPRYRRFRWFFRRVLREVDVFLAQSADDAQRLLAIGAPEARISVSGNLKFDIRPAGTAALVPDLRSALAPDALVLVCGSTTEGEEELLLDAYKHLLREFPAAVMVLAPRHPERFDKVANLISLRELGFVRRSTWTASCPIRGGVFLLDSVGELASVYALAHLAFVGGSLFPLGGHNILEPAQFGVPVITGPYTFNFREIVRIFEDGGGLRIVTAEQLAGELSKLAGDVNERNRLGTRAQELFMQHAGGTRKTVDALRPLLERP